MISITYTEQAQLLIGAVSMMPDNHFHTMRRDTVEKLKEIGVRLLRWPDVYKRQDETLVQKASV